MKRVALIACFVVMLSGGAWPVVAPFVPATRFPTSAPQARAEHRELQCFAEGVFAHTEKRASIRFVLPDDESDGGLVNHRLRYIVPGRTVITSGDAQYVASWHEPVPIGRPVWSGCGGVLVRK